MVLSQAAWLQRGAAEGRTSRHPGYVCRLTQDHSIQANAPTLVIDALCRRYGPRWAVANVSVTMEAGSAWMLTGPNGSGKSTLLRCMATALKPHRGHIRVDGADLWEHRSTLRHQIAYFGHDLHVWDDLSPRQNLLAWARLASIDVDVDALLERVDLEPNRDHPVRAMSAGMKRRLGLARLLLKKPRVALLDEPFGALDPEGRALVLDVIRELRANGTTIALATHLPHIGAEACSHGLALEAGQLLWAGTASGLLERVA